MYPTTQRRLVHPYGCPADILLLDQVNAADELRVIREWADGPGRDPGVPRGTVIDVVLQMIDNTLAGREATDNGDTL